MRLSDTELLERLVAFDSTSAKGDLAIADFVCEYLEPGGLEIARNESADGSRVNIVAVAPAGGAAASSTPDGDGLLLCGHLDVVPAEEEGWTGDPFTLRAQAGNLVGRGACDMKGSVALALNLLLEAESARLAHPLAVLLTYDEELGSLGAQRFCETWSGPLPTQVVVGEPTSLRAVRMHKGHLTLQVTIHGKGAHSGSPHLGANAIEAAARVVQGLTRLAETLKRNRADTGRFFPAVPFTVLNVVRIHGGSAMNVVPDRCVIDLGVRLLPGANDQAIIEWIRDTVAKSAPGIRKEVEVLNNNPPLLCPEGAPVHAGLCELLGQRQSFGAGFASDAGVLSRCGYECVLFGPGSIDVAHKPEEFVPLDELSRARATLERLIERFCYR
ncbi:MAG: acetylornithine deacetylase [Planctomycetota bacterium]